MTFIRRVVGDAIGLLAVAPPDLILSVAVLYVLGALLTVAGGAGALAITADFVAGNLLVAGLLGSPGSDGVAAAARRLGRRLIPVLGQLLVMILLFVGIAIVASVVVLVIVAVAGPAIGVTFDDVAAFPPARQAGLDRATTLFLVVAVVLFLPFFARFLPATAIVLDREVGPVESVRASWAATRGRTLACAVVFLLVTAPAWVALTLLPLPIATILAILPTVFGGAAGVAAYRILSTRVAAPTLAPTM